jgi:hypothetical protein
VAVSRLFGGSQVTSVSPKRILPSLGSSSLNINASLLEAENKMLKEKINQLLSQQRHDA